MKECEELLKFVQRRRESRVARGCKPPDCAHVPSMPEAEASRQLFTTGQNFQAGQVVCSRLELATQPSCEVKPPKHPVWQNMIFHIPSYPTIYIYPYTHDS